MKNVLIYVLSGVLSLLGIGYIVFHLVDGDIDVISTEATVLVQTENRVQAEAVIFRDEIAIEGQGEDVCGIVRDGEKVKAGTEVLRVFHTANKVSTQILELEKQIRILQDSLTADGIPTAHSSNEKELKELYYTMLNTVHGGSLINTGELGIQLQTHINVRKHSSTTEAAIKDAIQQLENKKTELLEMYKESITVCKAPATGMYYTGSDGFEVLCTLQTAKEMNYSDFTALRDEVVQTENANGIGRIVTDTYWYIAFTLEGEIARELQVGKAYPICFDENKAQVVYMTLERMDAKYKQSDCLVVFGCRTVPTDFDFKRSQQVSLLVDTMQGLHVPAGAVRYLDGKIGVYVTEGNKVVFRRIDILCVKDGYYTVKQHDITEEGYTDMLRLHDKIILTGKGLYHGKYLS